jgi:hypothetical protein
MKKSSIVIAEKRPTYLDLLDKSQPYATKILTELALGRGTIEFDALRKQVSEFVDFNFSSIEFDLTLNFVDSGPQVLYKCRLTNIVSPTDNHDYRTRNYLESARRDGIIPVVPDMKDEIAVAQAVQQLHEHVWTTYKRLAEEGKLIVPHIIGSLTCEPTLPTTSQDLIPNTETNSKSQERF